MFGWLSPCFHPSKLYEILYVFFVRWALNVTSLPLVECRFINDVASVLAIDVAFVVLLPYVWVTVSIPLISQPLNVYPVLVGLLTVNGVS